MAVKILGTNPKRYVDEVTPAAQASVNAETVLAGSEMDTGIWTSLAYTVVMAVDNVTWTVYGANASTYADEVIVDGPTAVAAAATDSYAVNIAPYRYYRVKINSTVPGNHGTVTLRGIAKA